MADETSQKPEDKNPEEEEEEEEKNNNNNKQGKEFGLKNNKLWMKNVARHQRTRPRPPVPGLSPKNELQIELGNVAKFMIGLWLLQEEVRKWGRN